MPKTKESSPEFITDFDKLRAEVRKRNTYIPNSMDFVRRYRMLKGETFSFDGRDYLKEIYGAVESAIAGTGPKQIIIKKCVQSEFTETMVNLLMWFLLKYPHTTGIYTAPRQDQVSRVSKDRIKKAIEESPDIQKRVADDGDVTRLVFDNGSVLYMYSSWGDADALRNIPADIVVGDEIQDMDANAFGVLQSRLDHSKYGVYILLGSPKIPGTEFERLWLQSNCLEWEVICSVCGHEQVMSFDNVAGDEEGRYFGCSAHEWEETEQLDTDGKPVKVKRYTCRAPLDRGTGTWSPGRTQNKYWKGMHVSQYMVPWKTAEELFGRKTYYKDHIFVNEIEGEFYSGEVKPVTLQLIMKNVYHHNGQELTFKSASRTVTTMGIDWMNYPVVAIVSKMYNDADPKGNREIHYLQSWDGVTTDDKVYLPEIIRLARQFNVGRIVADMGYGIVQNRELMRKFGNRLYGCWYKSPSDQKITLKLDEETKMQIVNADRSYFAEEVIDHFKKLRYIIPYGEPERVEWAFEQWSSIEAEDVKSATGKEFRRYDHDEANPDHAFHALMYCEMALSNHLRPMDFRNTASNELFWGGGSVDTLAEAAQAQMGERKKSNLAIWTGGSSRKLF